MSNKKPGKKKADKTAGRSARGTIRPFAEVLADEPELSGLRTEYARKSAAKRRAAAQWSYDAAISDSIFGAMISKLHGQPLPAPEWPSGYSALAIDPQYAPALLTVGCHDYWHGLEEEGMGLLLELTRLPPETEDWAVIIDKAGQGLVDAGGAEDACRLYEAALEARPDEPVFVSGLAWALCRAEKQEEALPWLKKAMDNDPANAYPLNDYGWALVELGRFDEAEKILRRAIELAPADYTLPAGNLEELRRRRKSAARSRPAANPK